MQTIKAHNVEGNYLQIVDKTRLSRVKKNIVIFKGRVVCKTQYFRFFNWYWQFKDHHLRDSNKILADFLTNFPFVLLRITIHHLPQKPPTHHQHLNLPTKPSKTVPNRSFPPQDNKPKTSITDYVRHTQKLSPLSIALISGPSSVMVIPCFASTH